MPICALFWCTVYLSVLQNACQAFHTVLVYTRALFRDLNIPRPAAALLSATAVPNPVIGQGTTSHPMGAMGSYKYAHKCFIQSNMATIYGLTNYGHTNNLLEDR